MKKAVWLILAILLSGCAAQASADPAPALTPGPIFPLSVSGGEAGSMYPGQDLSIIAQTGRLQFINVYANW